MPKNLLLHIPDLTEIINIIKAYDHIVFLGTGGSSLVGQALHSIAQPSLKEHIIFFDNIDPRTFREKILPLTQKNTFFIIISKSGNTSETLAQTLSLIPYLSTNVLVITQNKPSALYDLACLYQWRMMEHPIDIGGRFSAFTIVGLLPCALLGLSTQNFLEGAKTALSKQASIEANIKNTYKLYPTEKWVLLSYSDYTNGLLSWMAQLISESLGKKDRDNHPQGITPIITRGTIDQHSQLQLWLDGPKNHFFQMFFFHDSQDQSKINADFQLSHDAIRTLDQKSYSQIFNAHYLATMSSLKEMGYFVQDKEYPILNEKIMGELMMEKFIEVFTFAQLMHVEALGQPAVEKAKTWVGKYL